MKVTRVRLVLMLLLVVVFTAPALGVEIATDLEAIAVSPPSGAREREVEIATEFEAIEPPRVVIKGRVLRRDGVTGVERAELTMTSASHGFVGTARSGRGGRFKIRLPAGEYRLIISRSSAIYESPSVYRVVPGGALSIDFLLLRDFDGNPGSEKRPIGSGPAPIREPAVVGSVIDVIRDTGGKRRHRWREALAFIGSILAVAAAAD